MRFSFWILTALISLLTFIHWFVRDSDITTEIPSNIDNEEFDPSLGYINSLDRLIDHIDSMAVSQKASLENPQQYVLLIDEVIRNRFYHGISHIGFGENWLAYFSGILIWDHFSVGVDPSSILNHSHALCSQSAIVFQEVAKAKKFKIRAIGLKNHFCSEIFYENSWHFIDSDFEPHFNENEPIPNVEELAKNLSLTETVYINRPDQEFFKSLKEQFNDADILKYPVNVFPADNMLLFQHITGFLSDFLWIIMTVTGLVFFANFRRKSKVS